MARPPVSPPLRTAASRLLACALLVCLGVAQGADLTAARITTSTFTKPVCIAFAPGDSATARRAYIVEKQTAKIWIVLNGVKSAQPFMTLPFAVGGTTNEGGLLSLAFDPDFATNHLFYLYYADTADHAVVDRYTATADGNGVDLASRVNLLTVQRQTNSDTHYGSWMGFNPRHAGDAARRHYLYITIGESNHASAAQDLTTLLGKLARIDVDPAHYPAPGGAAYGVPADNPIPAGAIGFTSVPAGAKPEILALGLRNPWRASFDRQTGDLLIGNVGDHGVNDESIFIVPFGTRGQNFRWNVYHGDTPYNPANTTLAYGVPTGSALTLSSGAVIGGYVYRGTQLTGWQGKYLFNNWNNTLFTATYTGGALGTATQTDANLMANARNDLGFGPGSIPTFGEDQDGEIYFSSYDGTNAGSIFQIRLNSSTVAPAITSAPVTTASVGFPYVYTVVASGTAPLTYSLDQAPTGMAVAANGRITWTPGAAGPVDVTVRVTNGAGHQTQSFTVTAAALRDPELTAATGLQNGLDYQYSTDDDGHYPDVPPNFDALTITASGTVAQPDPTLFTHQATNYAVRFAGYVLAPQDGLYAFATTSDDGSLLFIGDRLVVDNHGAHGSTTVSGSIGLAQGYHRLTVLYQQLGGGAALGVTWTVPGSAAATIPATSLFRSSTPYGLESATAPRMGPYLDGAFPATSLGALPATLSATGIFANVARLEVAAGIVPYTVNSPLWSDGADKLRWLAVPAGGAIGFDAAGNWSFPEGTAFIKHFALAGKRLETRVLVITAGGGAYGVTYKWRADDSEADLDPGDAPSTATVPVGGHSQTWTFPSRSNCMQCHTSVAGYALGVRTRQLNRTMTYAATGVGDNQLRTLNHLGLFASALNEAAIAGYDALAALTDTTASLEKRARSYLDSNCMHCHQPDGPATPNAVFDARYTTALGSQRLIGTTATYKLDDPMAQVVYAGSTEHSVLYRRIASTDASIAMPPIGRSLVDPDAESVFGAWIGSLSGGVTPPPPSDTGDSSSSSGRCGFGSAIGLIAGISTLLLRLRSGRKR